MARRIAVFTKNRVNSNYAAFFDAAARAARAAGATATWHTPETPDDPVQQTALLRAVAAEQPDAILYAPADDIAMEGPVAEVNALGIPLIGFVNRMRGDFVSFIGSDDRLMGDRIATYLLDAIGGRGSVVLIEGPQSAPTARDRGEGFRDALARFPGVTLLGAAPGRYLRDGGQEAMRALLAVHPTIDGVICTNDMMALGALDALAEAGRGAIVSGINGTIEAGHAIAAGRLLGSMDYCGMKMGAVAMMAALRHLDGLPVPRTILLPAQLIDRANHAAWLVPVADRPLPAWNAMVPGG